MSIILEEQSKVPEESQADTLQESRSFVEDDSDEESSSNRYTHNDGISYKNDTSAFDDNEDDSSECNINESAYVTTTLNEKQI